MTIPTDIEQKKFLNKLNSMSSSDIQLKLNQKVWNGWKRDLANTHLIEKANQKKLDISNEANEISREANEISKKANKKSTYSIWIAFSAFIVSIASLFLHR